MNGRIIKLLYYKVEIAQMLGFSVRSLDRKISSGEFPQPDKIVGKRKAWRLSTVESWIDNGV